MKTFYLHGDMADNFCEKIKLNVSTIREFFTSLSSNYPNFRKYFINKSLNGVQYVFVDENQDKLEHFFHDLPLKSSEYHVLPVVEGAAQAAMGFVGNFAMGYAMQTIMNKIQMIEDDGTPEYEKITTNSFIYNDNENTIEQGTPIPVVYGQLRVGTKVINSSIHNYDYDYDDAKIYENPGSKSYSKLVDPNQIIDYRNLVISDEAPPQEMFSGYSNSQLDPTKRSKFVYNNRNQNKSYNPDAGNGSSNYQQGGKSNEWRITGPSNTPNKPSWWNHDPGDTSSRPTIWGEGIDENMRPQNSSDLCVETIFPNKKNHSFDRSQPLTVGDRGKYHKLESISVYKSIEILSEGPIVGLASPITGFSLDNGLGRLPYFETLNDEEEIVDIDSSSSSVRLGSLKFNVEQQKITSFENSSALEIISAGKDYDDFNGRVAANDLSADFYIRVDQPASVGSADVDIIDFGDESKTVNGINNSVDNVTRIVSSSDVFILNPEDGRITFNSNSDSTTFEYPLAAQYINTETFTYNGGSVTTQVMNLRALSESEDIAGTFDVGIGYKPEDLEYTIHPNNEDSVFHLINSWNSKHSRVSQAKVFDGSKMLDGGSTFISEDLEYIKNQYLNSSKDKFLSSLDWDKLPRIYYDGDALDSDKLDVIDGESYDSILSVHVGSIWLGTTQYNLSQYNIHLRVPLKTYIGLGKWNRSNAMVKYQGSWVAVHTFSWANRDTFNNNGCIDDDYAALSKYQKNNATNYFDNAHWLERLLGQKVDSVDLAPYLNASIELSSLFANAAGALVSGLRVVEFNKRKFIKFGVGTGSNLDPKTNRINNLPSYMLTEDCDNFDQVYIEDDGSIEYRDELGQEARDPDRGFYYPFLFPRVTVFVLRANVATGSVTAMATSIEAVASVSSKGTVNGLHLLHVPDLPVYDTTLQKFTPIYPFYESGQGVYGSIIYVENRDENDFAQTMYQFCDTAIVLSIDSSSDDVDFNLRVEGDSFVAKSENNRLNSVIESNFENHIKINNPKPDAPTNGAGIFAAVPVNGYNSSTILSKRIELNQDNTELVNTGTDLGYVSVNLENIDLTQSGWKKSSIACELADANWSTICTGRPTSVDVIGGSGYQKENGDSASGELIKVEIYPRSKNISKIEFDSNAIANGKGLGYKPNDTFFIYGGPALLGLGDQDPKFLVAMTRFKAKVKIDSDGKIDSITVIDPGYGFENYKDTITNAKSFLTCNDIVWVNALVNTQTLNTGLTNSADIFPENNFTKNPLIIRVAEQHIKEEFYYGKISKFYIHQEGEGFIKNQIIDNFFVPPTTSVLEFDILIENGSLRSMVIVGDTHEGYTEIDSDIQVKFPAPSFELTAPKTSIESDKMAWAYSIYLNDSPIRDKNGYFNYSKFHFDIRSGHIKNGKQEISLDSDFNLLPSKKDVLMEKEFQYPCNTKMINYPLYGPRNNGDMDYYYTHTIKNPNVDSIVVSINIKELHYIYEGDESAVYINLSPILILAILYYLITEAAQSAIEAASSSVLIGGGTGGGGGSAQVAPCTGTGSATVSVSTATASANPGPGIKAAALALLVGTVVAVAISFIADKLGGLIIKCSTIPFLCIKLGEIIKNSGEIWPAKVYVNIEYGLEGEQLTKETIAFRGCATNEYVKDIPIENLPSAKQDDSNNFKNRIVKVYRTTREVDPVRQGIIEARYKIKTELHSITEHIDHVLSFPNTAIVGTRLNSKDHPQLPRREYLIKGKLIKIPSNYSALTGVYSGTWNGSFKTQWTSNPAWIIYDLLTNVTYGMGKYGILENQVDKWSFYRFAEHCDEKIDTVIDGVVNTGGSAYQERRHMCNLYVDTEQEAYAYIQKLLSIYSASINFSGNQIYITYDKQVDEDEIVMLFTNSNIHEDGFSYSSTPTTSRITAVTVDYLDERDNYMRKSEYVEDPTYIAEHGYSHIKIPGIAITRRGEAHRLAWQKILTQQLEREIIEFKAGLQASYLKIGDVVDVLDNNKVAKHYGGKILKVIDSRNIEIDIPASIITNATSLKLSFSNTNYSQWSQSSTYNKDDIVYSSQNFLLYIKTSDTNSLFDPSFDTDNWSLFENSQEQQFATYDISSTSGFRITFDSDIDSKVKAGNSWLAVDISVDNAPKSKPYRIKSIKEIEDMVFSIIAVEYVDNKYNFVNESSSNSLITKTHSYNEHQIDV